MYLCWKLFSVKLFWSVLWTWIIFYHLFNKYLFKHIISLYCNYCRKNSLFIVRKHTKYRYKDKRPSICFQLAMNWKQLWELYGSLKVKVLLPQSSLTLQPHGLWPARLLCPWDSSGKKSGMGSHSLLQGIFETQGLNLGLLHCRQILYCLSHLI